ncbi:MAG: 5'-nucleotidase C-terminal domain-containing protein [Bacillus sp. (in: Bacteria)]|nr:5'-nucleotidase C-terminal domain-containing protein [Bacillus sp. (in: firmicutes)]
MTGATVPFHLFYKTLGWHIKSPKECLKEVVNELAPQVDLLICLSHLGLFEDERLAEEIPEFDYILGAHTHHVLENGKKVNGTWLNQAGRSGKYVGEISAFISTKNKETDVTTNYVRTIRLNTMEKDLETEQLLLQLNNTADNAMGDESLITLIDDLDVDWYAKTPLIQMLAEGLREWCDAEIAMVNAGVLLSSLSKGKVTYKDIHRICPHPINPVSLLISGESLFGNY